MSAERIREALEVILEARSIQQVEAGTMASGHVVEEKAGKLHDYLGEDFT